MADDKDTKSKPEKENENSSSDDSNKDESQDESKVYGDSDDDSDDDSGDEKADAEQVENNVKASMQQGVNGLKKTLSNILGFFKALGKLFKKLAELGWVGWIIIAVILVILIIIIVIFSFTNNNKDKVDPFRSLYDTQDYLSEYSYDQKQALKDKMDDVQTELKDEMGSDEYNKLKDDISSLSTVINDYGDSLVSSYDTVAGYQVLNQDGTILQIIEELSYAYKYTSWEMTYDTGSSLEEEIQSLEEAIAEQESSTDSENKWSSYKLRSKKKELEELKDESNELEYYNQRYCELNTLIKDRIEKDFINSSKKSKVHPDGTDVTDKVVSYFKDRYGVEYDESTSEFQEMATFIKDKWGIDFSSVQEELNYFHTIIQRKFTISKEKEDLTSINAVLDFIDNPGFTKEDMTEEDSGIDLSSIEEPFKVQLEIIHNEVTLKLINNDTILNSIFTNSECMEQLKNSVSAHMPLFEYATYSDKVIDKTFYDYELFDSSYFDAYGNYLFQNNFESKLKVYTDNDSKILDFSPIEEQQEKEYELASLKAQLEYQEGLDEDKKDRLLIEELKEQIVAAEETLASEKSSEELLQEYKTNFKTYLENKAYRTEEYRPYDAHNHNVIVDTKTTNADGDEEYEYYIERYGMPLDSYQDTITITETMQSKAPDKEGMAKYYGSWITSTIKNDNMTKTYSVKIDSTAYQSSLKILKIRSLLNNADYTYTKTEVKKTNDEIQTLLKNKREAGVWQQRTVTYKNNRGEVDSTFVEYRKVTEVTFNNGGSINADVQPWDTNEDMYLDNSTYLTDFYGQTQLITEEYSADSPGTISNTQIDNGIYVAGHVNYIPYFSQRNYANNMYGHAGTIKAAGCGPTSLAMIYCGIKNITNGKINGEDAVVWMANWACENDYRAETQNADGTWSGQGSYAALFVSGPKKLGLNVNAISRTNKQELANALAKNHAVAMLCGKGDFTGGGHYIVLTGIDENGNVSVNDPNSVERSNQKWPIDQIMSNAINIAQPYWEIY